jgi:UDP-N-acetylglucosamine--N-acetylmuramyl-(pentapeptide) pyrophosphoryl-undecaprenol N-acetylglucosamine transferase
MSKIFKIIFTGGGSGGHTMPALAMINGLKKYALKNDINFDILYLGSHDGIEKSVALKNGINYKSISTGKLRRYFSLKNISDIIRILKGLLECRSIIKKFKPDILVSTGGFVSVPPVISAKKCRVPVIIHEQTIDAGLANKIAARFADRIALTFAESSVYFPKGKIVITGIPLREEIFEGDAKRAFEKFHFDPEKPVIYFTGGGLGCHILNETAMQIIPDLLKRVNIIFQTGKSEKNNDFEKLNELKSGLDSSIQKNIRIYDFINEDLPDILSITDIAVSRSGAGTVNEFMALNIPTIFIPLAIATNDEQFKNAEVMRKAGGALIIRENELTPMSLLNAIESMLANNKYKDMKKSLSKHGNKNGLENMINLIMEYLT